MSEKRKKYNILDLNQREEIIRILKSDEENGVRTNCSALGKQYQVSDITIRRIRDSQPYWKAQFERCEEMPSLKKRKKLRVSAKNVLLEKTLYEWFQERILAGLTVSGLHLKSEALSINNTVHGDPNFKASDGWLANFKERYQCLPLSNQGEFSDHLASIMRLRNFQLYEIYNADETSLLWRMLPMIKFVDEYEKGASGFKFSMERVTIMVCANADGSHKIPLLVIGESKNPRCFGKFNRLPVTYESQKNAWMTRQLFKKWYINVFLPSVRQFQAERQQRHQVLLILDNAKCHLSEGELESIDNMCTVEFLPHLMSSSIQPMAQGVIEEMKMLYRKSSLREMLLEKNEQSLLEFVKNRNMKTCCTQIASAWSQITARNIRRSWRELIPSCDLVMATPVNSVSLDEFSQIFHRIPGFKSITPTEISAWLEKDSLEPGWEMSSIEQILHRQSNQIKIEKLGEQDPLEGPWEEDPLGGVWDEDPLKETCKEESEEEEKEEEEEEEEKEGVIIKNEIVDQDSVSISLEAVKAYRDFNTFREWFEKQCECDPHHLIQLQQFNELCTDIVSRVKDI